VTRTDQSTKAGAAVIGRPLPADARYQDLRIGMLVTSPEVAPAPDGLAAGDLGSVVGLLESVRPCLGATVGQLTFDRVRSDPGGHVPVHLAAIITRLGPPDKAGVGRVTQDLRLVDPSGTELGRARAGWLVPSAESLPRDEERTALSVGSVEWGKRVAERLASNAAFHSTTRPFDGAIGFSAGPDEVNFRIYRGKVVEVARKSVTGPTFVIDAPELTWLELLTSPVNDYFRRTMTGAFKIRGDGFQYVRMIKAIMLILDDARAEAAEAFSA
jgi:hypothetical protein